MLILRDLLAANPNVQAIANFFALATGATIVVQLGRRGWRFWRVAVATSIRKARHRARIARMLEAELCSREPSFYIARILRLFFGFGALALFTLVALSTEAASMARLYAPPRDAFLTPSWWAMIVYLLLLLGVITAFAFEMTALGRGVVHFTRSRQGLGSRGPGRRARLATASAPGIASRARGRRRPS